MINDKDNAGLLELIRSRLADYTVDVSAERAKLVEAWRKHHPEAAEEPPSVGRRPLILIGERGPSGHRDLPDEEWANDIYSVTLRRKPDRVFGTRQGMIQLRHQHARWHGPP